MVLDIFNHVYNRPCKVLEILNKFTFIVMIVRSKKYLKNPCLQSSLWSPRNPKHICDYRRTVLEIFEKSMFTRTVCKVQKSFKNPPL